jgi:hypothetical protein
MASTIVSGKRRSVQHFPHDVQPKWTSILMGFLIWFESLAEAADSLYRAMQQGRRHYTSSTIVITERNCAWSSKRSVSRLMRPFFLRNHEGRQGDVEA